MTELSIILTLYILAYYAILKTYEPQGNFQKKDSDTFAVLCHNYKVVILTITAISSTIIATDFILCFANYYRICDIYDLVNFFAVVFMTTFLKLHYFDPADPEQTIHAGI